MDIGSSAVDWLFGSSGGGSGVNSSLIGAAASGVFGAFHGGAVVGYDPPAFTKQLPKFHSGLMSDEFMAILKKGESVLTPRQSDNLVSSAVAAGASIGGAPNVNVQVNNAPSDSTANVTTSQDGNTLNVVVDLVTRKMQAKVNRGYQGVGSAAAW